MELRTICIPASMDDAITYLDETVEVAKPIHVVGTSENPDDFCLAFYAATGSEAQDHALDHNHRASLIAMAASSKNEESPAIIGDVLLALDPGLADKIVENDVERMRDRKVVQAFREWMLSYSEVNGEDVGDVFAAVASYAAHIEHETHEAIRRDHAEMIAGMMGLKPEQVGVFFV